MNPFEMVAIIVIAALIAGVLRSRRAARISAAIASMQTSTAAACSGVSPFTPYTAT